MGFLRALVDRAALHEIDLQLHWNRGRKVSRIIVRPGAEPLYFGAILGALCAYCCTRLWYIDTPMALLIVGAGLVAGKIRQRTHRIMICGDPLCRNRIESGSVCSSCGSESDGAA